MSLRNQPPIPDLAGRVAIVTGAGRGIGRALALDLARAGAAVAVVARSADQLAETAAGVSDAGGRALAVPLDIADHGTVPDLVRRVEESLGAVDILVNNAGTVAPLGPTESLPAADVAAAFQLNVLTPILLAATVVPGMRRRGWGRVVNVSSGIVANPAGMVGGNVYTATKAALEAHTSNLAAELDGTGVTVNVYRPGRVDTAMQGWIRAQDARRVGGGLVERFVAAHEAGALITAAESARALVDRIGGDETGQIWDVADVPASSSEGA
jgi:NAD(P)-dependent dehydrogenase (short-subunit alcohol dehydrogenase family)